jgi:hypothetical protein
MPRVKEYLPIGKDKRFNLYHETYDRLRLASKVLNADANNVSIHMKFFNEETIKNEIRFIEGDEGNDGYYNRDTKIMPSKLQETKDQLDNIELRYESYIKIQVRQGQPKPTDYPPELLKEKLKLEAKLSVLHEELAELQKQLKPYEDKVEEASDRKVLQDGPIGSGRLRGGFLIELDGMKVSLNEDEIPFINDKRAGKYDGFSTADYYTHVVKPFLQAKEKQRAINIQQAKKEETSLDKMTRGKRNGSVKYPEMPKDCINYKLKVKEEI